MRQVTAVRTRSARLSPGVVHVGIVHALVQAQAIFEACLPAVA